MKIIRAFEFRQQAKRSDEILRRYVQNKVGTIVSNNPLKKRTSLHVIEKMTSFLRYCWIIIFLMNNVGNIAVACNKLLKFPNLKKISIF